MGNQLRSRSLRKKSARRKAARLLATAAMQSVQKQIRASMKQTKQPITETYVRMGMRRDQLVVHHRQALLGNTASPLIVLDPQDIVGLVEDPQEFTSLVARLGMTTLGALLGFGFSPDSTAADLAKALVTFTGVDIDKLQAEAAADSGEKPVSMDDIAAMAKTISEAPAETLEAAVVADHG